MRERCYDLSGTSRRRVIGGSHCVLPTGPGREVSFDKHNAGFFRKVMAPVRIDVTHTMCI